MKAIRAKGLVQQDHKVLLQLPGDIAPGEHVFILVMEENESHEASAAADEAPLDVSEAWPPEFFRHVIGQWQGELEREQPPLPEESDTWV